MVEIVIWHYLKDNELHNFLCIHAIWWFITADLRSFQRCEGIFLHSLLVVCCFMDFDTGYILELSSLQLFAMFSSQRVTISLGGTCKRCGKVVNSASCLNIWKFWSLILKDVVRQSFTWRLVLSLIWLSVSQYFYGYLVAYALVLLEMLVLWDPLLLYFSWICFYWEIHNGPWGN